LSRFPPPTAALHPVGAARWPGALDLAWLGDGSGVVIGGQPAEAGESGSRHQVWLVSYPAGRLKRLTDDSTEDFRLTSAGAGRSLVALQSRYRSRLFLAPGDNLARARPITSFNDDTLGQFDWSPEGQFLYYIGRESLGQDVVLITNFRPEGTTP